jgi:endonuclease YncB( thermonuclease family)
LFLVGCAGTEMPLQPTPSDAWISDTVIAFVPDANTPYCAIIRVVDGDTIKMQCPTSFGAVRLLGYDTPETFQPKCTEEKELGEQATRVLRNVLSSARQIEPHVKGIDKYNRHLVKLVVDGQPLAKIMIDKGLAVPYSGGKRIDWCARLKA